MKAKAKPPAQKAAVTKATATAMQSRQGQQLQQRNGCNGKCHGQQRQRANSKRQTENRKQKTENRKQKTATADRLSHKTLAPPVRRRVKAVATKATSTANGNFNPNGQILLSIR
jgi:hypothetical protein